MYYLTFAACQTGPTLSLKAKWTEDQTLSVKARIRTLSVKASGWRTIHGIKFRTQSTRAVSEPPSPHNWQ